jgi:hypothetical protein
MKNEGEPVALQPSLLYYEQNCKTKALTVPSSAKSENPSLQMRF